MTAVEWLVNELQKAEYIPKDSVLMDYVINTAKEKEKEQQGYSEEEFKEIVYHMVGGLAQANNMTFNGAILDELFNKFKNK
jgi:hypothetical protein